MIVDLVKIVEVARSPHVLMDLSPDFALLSSARYDPALLRSSWNTAANAGVESPYLLLRYHYDRLYDAARAHGWADSLSFSYEDLERVCDDAVQKALLTAPARDTPLKLRVTVDRAGNVAAAASPTAALPAPDPTAASTFTPGYNILSPVDTAGLALYGPPLAIHLDHEPTPCDVFTCTKTTHRPQYNAARDRLKLPPLGTPSNTDVLLYNTTGELTETSIRNIAFLRGSPPRWVTPRAETRCLPGVMRRWLLEQARVVEAEEGELTRSDLVDGEYVLTFNGVEGCRLGRIAFSAAH
ncbi:hypothetical protein CERSUDRAFT_99358 [Gelatoporia subvermispora B]|uniref:Aminodeoxychorismate lyase n=1 Tax=Ceriporiopsis subvermispora (strain B) TaxID=914234 RepID=M2Q715_CERS8|nr:hypothetical protein CERSUDRAFT_99358 [Gelatoporia subvermispora B]